ncbi:mitochondrial ubiquitin ligase activator of nfkb 1 isoform X2 [Hydra vulgaris]|uniref:RING-type E3 ubiquitin transferase n=1 Tax=Hydra vulgaris TaxID=6087 RepID=A0ABM4CPI0_HYDVU
MSLSRDISYQSLYWCLGSSIISGLFYYGYYRRSSFMNILKNVKVFEINNDLIAELNNSNDCTLPYGAVIGIVKSEGKTIRGCYNAGVDGVVQNIFLKEHKTEWNSFTKEWIDKVRILSTKQHVEPFSLVDKSDVKVHVCDVLKAENLKLSTIYDIYEPSPSSITQGVIDFVAGDRVRGMETVEEMLLIGTKLVGVGQIVLVDGKHISLKCPSQPGLRYILSSDSISDLIEAEKHAGSIYKGFSIFFALISITFMSYWLYKWYRLYKTENSYNSLMYENTVENACSVCLYQPRSVVILPCGHVCSCKSCTERLSLCPICRTIIERYVPIFNS